MLLVLVNPLTLLGATTPGQSRPRSNGNEEVLCIPQSPSITGISPSDCLVSYQDTHWGAVLPLCRGAVSVFYSPSRLGKILIVMLLLNVILISIVNSV